MTTWTDLEAGGTVDSDDEITNDQLPSITSDDIAVTTDTVRVYDASALEMTKATVTELSKSVIQDALAYLPSGTGALTETVQAALRRLPHSAQYSSTANFDAAVDALTGRLGLRQLDMGKDTTVVVTPGAQTDWIRVDGTFTMTGAGTSVQGVHVNIISSSSSDSSSNMHAVIGTVFNTSSGETKGVYGRAVALTGSTGTVVGLISGITPASGTTTSAGLQVTVNSSGSSGDGVGKAIDYGTWIVAGNGAATANTAYGHRIDASVSITGAGFSMDAIGAGKFLQFRNSGGTADLFNVDSTGLQTIAIPSSGATMTGLRLVNLNSAASTACRIELSPSTAAIGTRCAQIDAVNLGSNNITFSFKLSNGDSPAEVFNLSRTRALLNGWFIQDEQDANPTTTELDANDSMAIYSKANKLVFAYNNAGTMTYVSLPLDGSSTTWTHSTSAP